MEFARGNLIQFSAVSCRNCRQNPAAEILLYNNYAGSETEGEVHWRRSSCVSGGARDSRQNPVAEILLCFKRDQRQRAKSIGCNLALFQAGPETASEASWRRSCSVSRFYEACTECWRRATLTTCSLSTASACSASAGLSSATPFPCYMEIQPS